MQRTANRIAARQRPLMPPHARPRRSSGRAASRPALGAQAGLSLVEVLISISLLGMFAIVFAPVVYHGLGITSNQATVAYAAQRAASYIDDARAATSTAASCETLLGATSGASPAITTDPRNTKVKVSGVVSGCATAPTEPTAVTLTVTACRPAAGAADSSGCTAADRTLTVVSTQILVRG